MDWSRWQKKAYDQITKYGNSMRVVVSTMATTATYNAASDTYSSTATVGYTTKGLYSTQKSRDDQNIVIEQKYLLIPGKDLPRLDLLNDVKVIDGSTTITAKNVSALAPGNEVILYKISILPGSWTDTGNAF